MENKKTFSNFKLLLEAKNIEENGSIDIFNSQKLLNSYFKIGRASCRERV